MVLAVSFISINSKHYYNMRTLIDCKIGDSVFVLDGNKFTTGKIKQIGIAEYGHIPKQHRLSLLDECYIIEVDGHDYRQLSSIHETRNNVVFEEMKYLHNNKVVNVYVDPYCLQKDIGQQIDDINKSLQAVNKIKSDLLENLNKLL